MVDMLGVITKLKGIISEIKRIAGGVFGEVLTPLRLAPLALRTLLGHIPRTVRLPLLCGSCLCLVIILGLLVNALTQDVRRGITEAAAVSGLSPEQDIPPEEYFLPAEPDFLPGILFERDKRESWTAADARSYWTDPLEYGAGPWLETVQSTVDELLERVP
ncbi:hypothetical protein FACS189461_1990 [Spirochaetia bacterium]|nr:hypothetical protein FACS189461_1990 [Spirochaetia bacterium]